MSTVATTSAAWGAPWLALVWALAPGAAWAHPSPAEPPTFFGDGCIEIVDKQAQPSWHLDYAVLADDTDAEVDHVSLPDSKTHQFFAAAGNVLERAGAHALLPFDADVEAGAALPLPSWISHADVMRTAAGVTPEDMTGFVAAQVDDADVLEARADLVARLLPLSAQTLRVPITEGQAVLGADWPLADVPVGAYQILGYIFSPPYNGWALRSGLVAVVDGDAGGAPVANALTLRSVAGRLFRGQGRRITGCVLSPPDGEAQVLVRTGPDADFAPWGEPTPIEGDELELCLHNDGLDAVLEVRVELRGPDGVLAVAPAPGELSLFSTAAACREDTTTCCPQGMAAPMGTARDAGPSLDGGVVQDAAPTDDAVSSQVGAGSSGSAGAAGGAGGAPSAGGASAGAAASPPDAGHEARGCRAAPRGRAGAMGGVLWILIALAWRRAGRAPDRVSPMLTGVGSGWRGRDR